MDASRFFVINLFSGTAQESRTKLSVLDPVRSFHPIQFCFGVQFAKPLHGLYSSGQASVVPLLACCVAHLAMLLTFEFAGPMKARSIIRPRSHIQGRRNHALSLRTK